MRLVIPLRIICFIIGLLVFVPVLAQGQEPFNQESLKERGGLSPAQQTTLESRRGLIIGEASTLPADEWIGTYGAADSPTSNTQFDWAPANGFLVWWSTCSHGWRDKVNFGKVDFREGVLRVIPELGSEGEKVYPLSGDLIPVKWGDQHYLIPLDRMIAFCYAVRNLGRSFEINEFLRKVSDQEKRRFGLPVVPLAYKKYLVGPPIEATIIDVQSREPSWIKTFTLNAGRTAGVVPGMKLFAVSPRNVYVLAEVITVRDNNAEAMVITSGFRNRSERELKFRVGWKLTSRAPKDAGNYYPG